MAMLAIATSIVTASSRLDIIDLPTGFGPEGITLAEEWTVYVGSFGDSEYLDPKAYGIHVVTLYKIRSPQVL